MSSLSMIPENQINTCMWREIKFNNNVTSTSSFTHIYSHYQLWMDGKIVKHVIHIFTSFSEPVESAFAAVGHVS